MLRTKLVITKKFTKRNTVNTENKGVMKKSLKTSIQDNKLEELYNNSEILIQDFTATCHFDNKEFSIDASINIPNSKFSIEVWLGEGEVELTDNQKYIISRKLEQKIEDENGEYNPNHQEWYLEDLCDERRF